MKNPFDPINNFDEWIQNDWESDDYIENHDREQQPAPGTGAVIAGAVIVIAGVLAVIFGFKACF